MKYDMVTLEKTGAHFAAALQFNLALELCLGAHAHIKENMAHRSGTLAVMGSARASSLRQRLQRCPLLHWGLAQPRTRHLRERLPH